jgi:hypothetical protein
MRKMMKLMAVVVAIAMISSVGIFAMTSSASTPVNVHTSGDVSIGFFNFNAEGVSNQLEVRLAKAPGGFAIQVPYTLALTGHANPRVRGMGLNDDMLEGPAAPVPSTTQLIFAGGIETIFGTFDPTAPSSLSVVDGVGTITFGEGNFAIAWRDGSDQTFVDLNGVVLTNQRAAPPTEAPATQGEPEPTQPPATPGEGGNVTEPEGTQPVNNVTAPATTEGNPIVGVQFAIIPALLAAGAAIVASRRRSK